MNKKQTKWPGVEKRERLVCVVIRGVEMRVPKSKADELRRIESDFSRQDWNRNQVD